MTDKIATSGVAVPPHPHRVAEALEAVLLQVDALLTASPDDPELRSAREHVKLAAGALRRAGPLLGAGEQQDGGTAVPPFPGAADGEQADSGVATPPYPG